MASAWECPFGSHSYLEVELESVSITVVTTVVSHTDAIIMAQKEQTGKVNGFN